jgi:hypothetical protein
LGALYNDVIGDFWVRFNFDSVRTSGTFHTKVPNLRGVVVAILLLLRIEPSSFPYVRIALLAPDIERHFKPNNQYALVELSGTISERMLANKGVD